MLETETIDKLFLELSQFTHAMTAREIELQDKYNELIMAVGRKFHNETRHQTALRYIRESEERALTGEAKQLTDQLEPLAQPEGKEEP